MEQTKRQRLGVSLLIASAVAFSTAGFFTRLIPLDVWTLLFWRGLFSAAFIACCVVAQQPRAAVSEFRRMGPHGLLLAALSAGATLCFINALRHTTVADVNIIFATSPFATAALAWLVIGERESRTTLLASFIAVLGVAMTVGSALAAGHLLGDLLAFGMTLGSAGMTVVIRRHRQSSMLPAASLSALLSALAVLPFAAPASVTPFQLVELALFGVTQFGLGLLLMTIGTRMISATQSALICVLEVPLACLWVALAFGEIPPAMTWIGGCIVLAAVLGHLGLAPLRAPRLLHKPGTT